MKIRRDTIQFDNWQKGKLTQVSMKHFCLTLYTGGGWLRLFGFWIKWKDTSRHPLLFSERMKLTKFFRIGNWIFGYLPKSLI